MFRDSTPVTPSEERKDGACVESACYIDPEERPPVFLSTGHEIFAVVILTFSTMMNTASSGAMQIAVPTLGRYFGISGADLSWNVSSFSLMSGASILLFSGIADKVGRKRVVFLAYAWFSIWCLAASFTTNHIVFDVCRGMQGLAAAACPSAGVGILGSAYRDGRRKNRIMAIFNAGSPVGAFLGTMTGGVTIQYINWKTIFYLYAVLYAILAALVYVVVPGDGINDNVKLSAREVGRRLGELDLTGAFLSIAGLVMFVLAAGQAGSSERGWLTPYVLIILVGSLVILATFVWWESRFPNPIMPLHIWKAPGFATIMGTVLFSWMAFTGVITFYSGLYFQTILGASPIRASIYYIPQIFASIVTVNIIAATLHVIPGRLIVMFSQLCMLAASLLWALMPLDISYYAMALPALCLTVIGADLLFNVANKHTLSTVSSEEQSTAAGVFYTISHISGSLGISLSSSIVAYVLRGEIANQASQMKDKVVEVTREMLARSYNGAFWFGVACSAVALILSCFARVGSHAYSDADDDEKQSGTTPLFVPDDDDASLIEECSGLLVGGAVMDYKAISYEKTAL